MILVDLESGVQRQFGSPAELAEAISRGEIGPGARIYHHRRDRWLPIREHPEFQRRWSGPVETPLPPLQRTRWTFFSVDPEDAHRPATEELRRPAPGQPVPEPGVSAGRAADEPSPRAWRRALGKAIRRLRPAPNT